MATSPPITNLKQEDFPGLDQASGGELDRLFRALNTALSTTAGQSSSALIMNNQAWQVKDIYVTPKDDWQTKTLKNNWTDFVGSEPCQHLRTEHGLILMRGRLAPGVGSKGAVAFTVDPDDAPSRTLYMITDAQGNANAECIIGTNGDVTINFNGAPTWVAVDNARWAAANRHPDVNPVWPMRVKLELGGRKVQGLWVILGHDVTDKTEQHIGNPVLVDGHQDGGDFVIEHISGLSPGRAYHIRILFLGA
ncbi:MAG TPA: hypothetical protein VFP65_19860 [Anaeromyxobacteraceae bacterium]|nr:hypothetical protein [Anaeromyxobacteraceae bacterium]